MNIKQQLFRDISGSLLHTWIEESPQHQRTQDGILVRTLPYRDLVEGEPKWMVEATLDKITYTRIGHFPRRSKNIKDPNSDILYSLSQQNLIDNIKREIIFYGIDLDLKGRWFVQQNILYEFGGSRKIELPTPLIIQMQKLTPYAEYHRMLKMFVCCRESLLLCFPRNAHEQLAILQYKKT